MKLKLFFQGLYYKCSFFVGRIKMKYFLPYDPPEKIHWFKYFCFKIGLLKRYRVIDKIDMLGVGIGVNGAGISGTILKSHTEEKWGWWK